VIQSIKHKHFTRKLSPPHVRVCDLVAVKYDVFDGIPGADVLAVVTGRTGTAWNITDVQTGESGVIQRADFIRWGVYLISRDRPQCPLALHKKVHYVRNKI